MNEQELSGSLKRPVFNTTNSSHHLTFQHVFLTKFNNYLIIFHNRDTFSFAFRLTIVYMEEWFSF